MQYAVNLKSNDYCIFGLIKIRGGIKCNM